MLVRRNLRKDGERGLVRRMKTMVLVRHSWRTEPMVLVRHSQKREQMVPVHHN